MQQSIPRCEYFAIPPFRYSIIPSNGVTLLISTHCSLRRYSGSFEHLSPIEMVKWSLFESMKFVFKVSSICRSNLFRHFCKGEVFFSITCMRRHYEIILRCLSSIVVSRLELKKLYLGIYWKLFPDSNAKMLSLSRKSFSSIFSWCADHHF